MRGLKTGGRQKGTPNKGTSELRTYAQQHSFRAIDTLAVLAGLKKPRKGERAAESDAVRVAALRELLDRAHGKPAQPVANDDDNPFQLLMESLDGLTRGLPKDYDPDAAAAQILGG